MCRSAPAPSAPAGGAGAAAGHPEAVCVRRGCGGRRAGGRLRPGGGRQRAAHRGRAGPRGGQVCADAGDGCAPYPTVALCARRRRRPPPPAATARACAARLGQRGAARMGPPPSLLACWCMAGACPWSLPAQTELCHYLHAGAQAAPLSSSLPHTGVPLSAMQFFPLASLWCTSRRGEGARGRFSRWRRRAAHPRPCVPSASAGLAPWRRARAARPPPGAARRREAADGAAGCRSARRGRRGPARAGRRGRLRAL